MSSWLSKISSSHQAQLVVTAVVSGVFVASAVLGIQHARRRIRVEDLKRSIPDLGIDHKAEKVRLPVSRLISQTDLEPDANLGKSSLQIMVLRQLRIA